MRMLVNDSCGKVLACRIHNSSATSTKVFTYFGNLSFFDEDIGVFQNAFTGPHCSVLEEHILLLWLGLVSIAHIRIGQCDKLWLFGLLFIFGFLLEPSGLRQSCRCLIAIGEHYISLNGLSVWHYLSHHSVRTHIVLAKGNVQPIRGIIYLGIYSCISFFDFCLWLTGLSGQGNFVGGTVDSKVIITSNVDYVHAFDNIFGALYPVFVEGGSFVK